MSVLLASPVPHAGWFTSKCCRKPCGPVARCLLIPGPSGVQQRRRRQRSDAWTAWCSCSLVPNICWSQRWSCWVVHGFWGCVFFVCVWTELIADMLGSEKYRLSLETMLASLQDHQINKWATVPGHRQDLCFSLCFSSCLCLTLCRHLIYCVCDLLLEFLIPESCDEDFQTSLLHSLAKDTERDSPHTWSTWDVPAGGNSRCTTGRLDKCGMLIKMLMVQQSVPL